MGFPTITWRNLTVPTPFGPTPLSSFPFRCRIFQDASEKDCNVKVYPAPKDNRFSLIVPIGLPAEGTITWLDAFHEKNPGFTEVSSRSIADWAEKSGVPRQLAFSDTSVCRLLQQIAAVQERNVVLADVRGNLIREDRK